jgi:2-methylcitrate dehydratase PrpD
MAWFSNKLSPEAAERVGKRGTSERYVQLAANAKMAAFSSSLAKDGFCGVPTAIEGANGLYSVYTGNASLPPEVLENLGREWHLNEIGVKAYPGSQVLPIYASERLAHENSLTYEEIDVVTVRMGPSRSYAGMTDQGPFTNAEQALVSFPFGIAATLIYGRYDMAVLLSAVGDPRVDTLAHEMQLDAKPLPGKSCEVSVRLKDDTILTADSSGISDELLRPDDWRSIVTRFNNMAVVLPEERRNAIVNEVFELDQRQNCHSLIQMLRAVP